MSYKQEKYITVHAYDTPQADFETDSIDGNGLAILMPTICSITEELNGTYELYMEHPIEEEGRWKLLEVDNIIKADGQLFRIKSRKTKLSANGEKVRSVQCLHIWYDLAGKACPSYTSFNFAAYWFIKNLDTILNDPEDKEHYYYFNDAAGWYRPYRFFDRDPFGNLRFTTDCGDTVAYAHIEPANIVSAAIGTESSFVNVIREDEERQVIDKDGNPVYDNGQPVMETITKTPELYRNNFEWSLNWKKEGSVENAFNITHKIDMIDIEETYDTSNYYTHVNAINNLYSKTIEDFVRGWGSEKYLGKHVPVQPKVKIVDFQYKAEEFPNYEAFEKRFENDFRRYFKSVTEPRLTLKCNYAELSDTDLYKDYIDAKHCNVGDSGTVYCEDLGITQTMKVVRKKKDLINKDKIEITFGSKLASITSPEYMSQTINNSKFTNNEFFKPVTIE